MTDIGTCNVVTTGNVLPGFVKEEVQVHLGRLFSRSPDAVARLLAGTPLTIKRQVDAATANEYVSRLKQIGVDCRVERGTLEIDDSVFDNGKPAGSPSMETAGFAMASARAPAHPSSVAGSHALPPTQAAASRRTDDDLWQAITQTRANYYVPKWKRYAAGEGTFPSWHWPAFFFGSCWALYRKAWAGALILLGISVGLFGLGRFLAGILAGINGGVSSAGSEAVEGLLAIAAWVVPPLFANGVYYRKARTLVTRARSVHNDHAAQLAYVTANGGVSWKSVVIIPGAYFLIGALAAVAVPAYHDYTVRSHFSEAEAAIAACKTSVSEFFAAHPGTWPKSAAEAGCSTDATQYVSGINVSDGGAITAFPAAAVGAGECSLVLRPRGVDTEGNITGWEGSSSCPAKFTPSAFRSEESAKSGAPSIPAPSAAIAPQTPVAPREGSVAPVPSASTTASVAAALSTGTPRSSAADSTTDTTPNTSGEQSAAPTATQPTPIAASAYEIDHIVGMRDPTVSEKALILSSPLADQVGAALEVGAADLDGDGVDELIVIPSKDGCGSGGCDTFVVKRYGSTVTSFALDRSTFFGATGHFAVLKESKNGFRLLGEVVDGKLAIGDKPDTPLYGKPMVHAVIVHSTETEGPKPPSASTSPSVILGVEHGTSEGAGPESVAYIHGNFATALRILRPLADNGSADAQNMLGIMYALGQGVPTNPSEAVKWFRAAADQGHANAHRNLGLMYQFGYGVPQRYDEAMKWYREAIRLGARAQCDVGLMYYDGLGVPKSDAEAVRWCRPAANQGDAHAQTSMGVYYALGAGVPRDYAEAAKWFRMAADQGDFKAQRDLGVLYERGFGVAQSVAEARKWYRKAADQGYAAADNKVHRYFYQ